MPKVVVGLSGGVDSSVAAFLLQQQGYEVSAVFMKNWEQDDRDDYCSAAQDAADAKAVAERLQIPFQTVNFSQAYWDRVFEYFLSEYQQGRTPNPDVFCNQEIKFSAFLDYAKQTLGADYMATGHYARCFEDEGLYHLGIAHDLNKDQSYFLYRLNQEQLRQAIFPLGGLTKPQVRQIALEQGFVTHNKKDSTGICFIGERRFKNFLQEYLPAKPGNIESIDGQILGQHDGLMYYTIGQRQGLRIGGLKETDNKPWYVAAKDLNRNVLIVAPPDHPALFKTSLLCQQFHWITPPLPLCPRRVWAKIRYRQASVSCTLLQSPTKGVYQVVFEEPQRAVTPGQSIVFYEADRCLGGGIIV